jgi:hypothetical protein
MIRASFAEKLLSAKTMNGPRTRHSRRRLELVLMMEPAQIDVDDT